MYSNLPSVLQLEEIKKQLAENGKYKDQRNRMAVHSVSHDISIEHSSSIFKIQPAVVERGERPFDI